MSWTPLFRGVDYGKRAELLLAYLKQKPEQFDKNDPFSKGYKNILAYIVASLCVRTEYRYISDGAQKQLKGIPSPNYNYVYNKNGHPEYKGLTNEHTIPVSVIVDHLLDPNNGGWTAESLTDFLKKVSGIALITTDENKRINKAGLRNKLPDGTTLADILSGKTEHSIRYEAAKIDMAETNHDAKA